MGGSNMQGPIICTASPQFVCGYSNGFPLATSISGARRMNSSADVTGGAPALARILLPSGKTAFSITPITRGRSAASRTGPAGRKWSQTHPKGRNPGDCRAGV